MCSRRINSADSIKFVVHLCSIVGLLAGGLWWFGNGFRLHESCVQHRMRKHPWYAFHVFIPTEFHPWIFPPTMICHWATSLSLARAAKRLFPSAGSRFLCVPALSHRPRVFCLGTMTFEVTLSNITSIDRRTDCRIWRVETMCGKRCFILLIGSHGCQRHGWTLNLIFQQTRPKITVLEF
jgi:hypothetical protein